MDFFLSQLILSGRGFEPSQTPKKERTENVTLVKSIDQSQEMIIHQNSLFSPTSQFCRTNLINSDGLFHFHPNSISLTSSAAAQRNRRHPWHPDLFLPWQFPPWLLAPFDPLRGSGRCFAFWPSKRSIVKCLSPIAWLIVEFRKLWIWNIHSCKLDLLLSKNDQIESLTIDLYHELNDETL